MEPTALITGASSGIGAATADRLAKHGFRVFGTSRHPDASAKARPHIHWIAMDVREDESVHKGVEQVLASCERLDALVCNAGFGIFGSVEEVSVEAAKQQFETNFFGTLRTLRAALPSMREAGRGRVVVVGSLSGRAPIPFQAHYSASKAALDALVLALHGEMHGLGVCVSLVEPGDIQTAFNDEMRWGDPNDSVYGQRIQRAEGVIRDSLPAAPGPERVARTIHRALTARRPRVRYACGPDSWLVPLGRRLLPDRLSLGLIRRHFRL